MNEIYIPALSKGDMHDKREFLEKNAACMSNHADVKLASIGSRSVWSIRCDACCQEPIEPRQRADGVAPSLRRFLSTPPNNNHSMKQVLFGLFLLATAPEHVCSTCVRHRSHLGLSNFLFFVKAEDAEQLPWLLQDSHKSLE